MADAEAAVAGSLARSSRRLCAARASGRDRGQRDSAQPALSRGHGAALRPREGVSNRQAAGAGRYVGDRAQVVRPVARIKWSGIQGAAVSMLGWSPDSGLRPASGLRVGGLVDATRCTPVEAKL